MDGPSQGSSVHLGVGPASLMPSVVGQSASPPAPAPRALLQVPWLWPREAGPTQAERCRESLSDRHPPSAILTTWEGSVGIIWVLPARDLTCFSVSGRPSAHEVLLCVTRACSTVRGAQHVDFRPLTDRLGFPEVLTGRLFVNEMLSHSFSW